MITFTNILKFKHGDLYKILYQSYQNVAETCDVGNRNKYLVNWKKFDDDAFDNPNIGKYVFITLLDGNSIGLFSYDPRHFPEYGVIGQNCIIKKFQGKGYGRLQIEKILEIFKKNKCKKAVVTTGTPPFFLPAQKMYQKLGFKEVKRYYDKDWRSEKIEYEKKLLLP